MVKTTLELKDEIYRKLVNEAVVKYGNTKSLSKVVNENLESHFSENRQKKFSDDEIKRRFDILKKTAGSWKLKKSGKQYVKEIRAGWRKRQRLIDESGI